MYQVLVGGTALSQPVIKVSLAGVILVALAVG